MHILQLLKGSPVPELKRIGVITGLAGLANAVLIALVNISAEHAAAPHPLSVRLVLLFLIAFAIYFMTSRASLLAANSLMQERLGQLRLRVTDKVRRAELRTLERRRFPNSLEDPSAHCRRASRTITSGVDWYRPTAAFP